MKTILITGATGFIARQLAARCREQSWRVVGTVRRPGPAPNFDATYAVSLGESLQAVFDGERVAAVIHAAYDAGHRQYEVNVRGTTRWLEEARAHAVPLQIFLSSLSATADPPSEYGRAKRDLEKSFLAAGGVVVRLGLVAGYGGIFGRMIDSVRRFPVLPLLDNGNSPVQLVDPRFLADVVVASIRAEGVDLRGRVWQIHQPTPHTLREVLEAIRRQCAASCRFVSVPSLPVQWALAVAERIPFLRLPVNSTNLRGLRRARSQQVQSDFERLGGNEAPLDSLIAEALRSS